MSPAAFLTVAAAIGCAGMVGSYTLTSVRRRRVTPGLWLSIALLSIFWMESPYDWAMYAQFNPAFGRFPDWGPLGMTYRGLPLMAPIGYVMYFGVPTAIALAVARRLVRRTSIRRPYALLAAGLAIGTLWDLTWEITGTRTGMWRFARTAPGFALWSGTKYQVPIYCFIAMGTFIMVCTYITGRLNDRGETVFETIRWSNGRPTLANLVGFVIVVHVAYALTMAPHVITKVAGMQTTTSSEPLFDDIPLQKE